MQGEAQHEVLVRDVDEELCGRALHDIADGLFDIGLQAGADDGCRLPRSRRDDATEHQRGEVPAVARSQLHAEVLGAQPVQQLPHLLLRGRHGGGERRLQCAVVRHPVGGDRDVHHDVADAELVDEVAEVAEARDELGLEGAEHRFADRALAEAAAEGDRSENAEYTYGKKMLREIDSRVRFLRKRLENLKVIRERPADPTKVYFGAWVTLGVALLTTAVYVVLRRSAGPVNVGLAVVTAVAVVAQVALGEAGRSRGWTT